MKQLQQRNAQLIDNLRADFQHRAEPNFAWRAACSMFLALPGLRGFWPMSSVDYTVANRGIDLSGQGNHLTANNIPTFNYDSLAPYVETDGVNQYLSRADGGAANWADITGTEGYINASVQGLTLGGWFWLDTVVQGAAKGFIGKYLDPADRSYLLFFRDTTDQVRFGVSNNGVAVTNVTSTTVLVANRWYFLVGRFDNTANQITVFVDNDSDSVAYNNNIFDSAADFNINSYGNSATFDLDGRASMCFLCAAQLSDAIILSLFEQTRAMYDV